MRIIALVGPDVRERVKRYAGIASAFRANLPRSLNRDAGLITAMFLAAFVSEEQENRRRGAIHLHVGAPVEQDRGAPGQGGTPVPQLHSGKQLRFPLTGTDIDGAPADVSGATAISSDEGQVIARIEVGGGVDLVVADVSGGNLGSAEVTVSAGQATLTETFEVIAGDAIALNLGAPAEEDRPA